MRMVGTSLPSHVRAGERYLHKVPAVIEPNVNMHIKVLYEDEAMMVLNKPALCLCIRAAASIAILCSTCSKRFTHPKSHALRHRLDANTTGVVVVARTRHFASLIQPQFADGDVKKVYLVRGRRPPGLG